MHELKTFLPFFFCLNFSFEKSCFFCLNLFASVPKTSPLWVCDFSLYFFFLTCSHFLCPLSMFTLLVVTLPNSFFLHVSFPFLTLALLAFIHSLSLSLMFLLFVFILFLRNFFWIASIYCFRCEKHFPSFVHPCFEKLCAISFFVSSLFLIAFFFQSCSFEKD